jgi:AraC family transcriptional regulator
MLKTESAIDSLLRPIELNQRLNTSPMLSSRQMGWNGVLVEQYQYAPTSSEFELPALSDHWFLLHLGQPAPLTQKRDDRLHESMIQKGDTIHFCSGRTAELLALPQH